MVGSAEKAKWITQELGFDSAIIYKGKSAEQIGKELDQLAPKGIDRYLDAVGGPLST